VDLVAKGCQGSTVQDPRRGVAYFFHRQVHPAHGLVAAVSAADVCSLAGTRYRREGAIEQSNYLSQINLRGVPCQTIASTFPLPALENAMVAEPEQDKLQELGRDLLGPGEIGDPHRLIAVTVGEREQRFDGVLGLLGEHCSGIIHCSGTGLALGGLLQPSLDLRSLRTS
jgi:hypothetical protein